MACVHEPQPLLTITRAEHTHAAEITWAAREHERFVDRQDKGGFAGLARHGDVLVDLSAVAISVDPALRVRAELIGHF